MAGPGIHYPEPSRLPIVQIASSGQSGRIKRPSRTDMGQAPDLFKRAEQAADAPETVRFPSPAIGPRLINSNGFDKAGGRVVQHLLRVVGI